MRRLLPVLPFALAASVAAEAQQLGARIPGQRPEAGMPRAAGAGDAVPCPRYGPGFVRMAGSSVCVRIGGEARFEYGVGGGRSGLRSGTRAGAVVDLDMRAQTELGEMRAVVRGGGAVETGVLRGTRW